VSRLWHSSLANAQPSGVEVVLLAFQG
jgi:hypothetical protein